jgi:hypothetical protein
MYGYWVLYTDERKRSLFMAGGVALAPEINLFLVKI